MANLQWKLWFLTVKMKNHKGMVVTGLTTMMLYFGTALLIIMFYFLFVFNLGETQVRISGYASNADLNYLLINYLRSTNNFQGQTVTLTDMLVIYETEIDKSKKVEQYANLLEIIQGKLNQLENCHTKPGITDKMVDGYGIFILDQNTYNDRSKLGDYSGSALKTDKKFRSNNFEDGMIDQNDATFLTIPTVSHDLIYLGFFKTTKNIFGIKSKVKGIPGCI